MQVLVLVLVLGYKKGNYLTENYSTFLLISPPSSSVLAMAGVQSSRSITTRNNGAATKAAEKGGELAATQIPRKISHGQVMAPRSALAAEGNMPSWRRWSHYPSTTSPMSSISTSVR